MVKNYLKSLVIHIVISFLSFIIYMTLNSSAVKWVSEEAAGRHDIFMITMSLIVFSISLLSYYYLSRRFCSRGNSILKDIASVSVVAILGIILWVIAFAIEPSGVGWGILDSKLWFSYVLFNNYSMFLLDVTRINNPYILLIFSLIPSITMYLGIKRKDI